MTPFKILLVEDDAQTAEMVRLYLQQAHFDALLAADGPTGERNFRAAQPHLVILDTMLPGFDGLELCRRIRQVSTVPILMLTARVDEIDKAVALGIGADDYLTKPFSPTELIARIKAMLRRAYEFAPPQEISSEKEATISAEIGGPRLTLDPDRHLVKFDGNPCSLTPLEFDLLKTLMTNPGWAFSRAHLLETVWDSADGYGEETVTVHVSNLRQKLGPEGGKLIRTVRGVGYAYEET